VSFASSVDPSLESFQGRGLIAAAATNAEGGLLSSVDRRLKGFQDRCGLIETAIPYVTAEGPEKTSVVCQDLGVVTLQLDHRDHTVNVTSLFRIVAGKVASNNSRYKIVRNEFNAAAPNATRVRQICKYILTARSPVQI
jgi:hypothetical protein